MADDIALLARARKPAKPRHRWLLTAGGVRCTDCGAVRDEAAVKRGRRNRQRGNEIERQICALLGIQRVGQFGGKADGGAAEDWIAIQSKSGTVYPERIDALLRAIPFRAGQLRGVVHADTPGSAGKRRMLITLDLGEFADWFGKG